MGRRENASFAALVGTMWLAWLWIWPCFMPVISSQAPFKDFAAQLETLTPEQQARLRQIAQQDPRIIWYSDVRFPRIIDQLKLLEMVGGKRDLKREIRIVGQEMTRQLERDKLVLLVSSPGDYIMFQADGRVELEREGRQLPQTHVWLIARKGNWTRRYVLFGNQPPPWNEPELPAEMLARLQKRLARLRDATDGTAPLPATQPVPTSDE
jgi:hypothetical protein